MVSLDVCLLGPVFEVLEERSQFPSSCSQGRELSSPKVFARPPTLEMQHQLLFDKIFALAKTVITKEKLVALTTKNGDTQASERTSIPLIKSVLNQLGLTYTEAGSQQSKDFRNVGGIGLDIEVKKTDGNTVTFNDTCPNKNIWYLILFTGKENTRTSIPPP